ncbi:MAG: hypothetical protein WCG50_13365 [Rhodoferax sp.]|uniref:hypothetical protein n=1 Tax=Rhodoferax sp. TaxID=50421 RepID=UPI00301A2455
MTWLDAASLCVFLCNIAFMVGAGMLLLKILGSVQHSELFSQKVLDENIEATAQLRRACNQLATQIEPTQSENKFHETSIGKAHMALSLQVRSLSDQLQASLAGDALAHQLQAKQANEELTQRMRDKLKDVLTQNIQLKDEIGRTKAKLTAASNSSHDIQSGMTDVQGASPAVIKEMAQRAQDLSGHLQEAQRRAHAAEKLAEANAIKLEDMREALSAKSFGDSACESVQMEKLRTQNEAMAARERSLLARIESMEMEFQRNLTEKSFIEERYVKLDAAEPYFN